MSGDKSDDPARSAVPVVLCAAALHLAACWTVFAVGRGGVLPGLFSPDGLITPVTPDQGLFRDRAAALAAALWHAPGEWLRAGAPLHVKLYALSFALTGEAGLPAGTLGAEPLNLLLYLAIVGQVYRIGAEALGRRAGLLAAAAVALWPSLLLCTTQLLRDPLFIVVLLALVRVLLVWLTRDLPAGRGALWGVAGGVTVVALWLVRWDLQEVVLGMIALGVGCLLVRQGIGLRAPGEPRPARILWGSWLAALLVCASAAGAPRLAEASHHLGLFPQGVAGLALAKQRPPQADAPPAGGPGRWARAWRRGLQEGDALAYRASLLRAKFVRDYPAARSNLDAGVRFRRAGDLLRYLPRALVIGAWAPFPRMWLLGGGQVGRAGRALAGLETVVLYLAEALALCTLWRRRTLPAALLGGVALIGLLALGLVVLNVGALYRIRYGFFALILVLAADTAAPLVWRIAYRCRRTNS